MEEFLKFITAILVLATALVGLIVVLKRAGKKATQPTTASGESKAKGPFQDLLEIAVLYGLTLFPIIGFGLFMGVIKFIAWDPNANRASTDTSAAAALSVKQEGAPIAINPETLSGDELRLYHTYRLADSISANRDHDKALQGIVKSAISNGSLTIAFVAASKIRANSDHDDALRAVTDAALAVKNTDIALFAILGIRANGMRDEAAQKAIDALNRAAVPPRASEGLAR